MTDRITLYGAPQSLYTGKTRCYFIKNGLAYDEILPTTEEYTNNVLPKAHVWMLPTVVTAEGEVIRDNAAIIKHYEELAGNPASPTTPRQSIISRLLDVIGAEGLLRPAMHYRWNFPENVPLLSYHFQSLIPAGLDKEKYASRQMDRMRQAGRSFGVAEDRFELIEDLYETLIGLLDEHFRDQPYFLGNKPSIGDFGMMAPLYGHLARDPAPLNLMQTKAVRLFRWVERMNRPDDDTGEYPGDDRSFSPNDEIPETLIAVLKHIAIDFVPETLAAADCINAWIEGQDELPAGTTVARGVGMANFKIRGQDVDALAQPYRFYLLKRVQDEYAALAEADQVAVRKLLTECDLWPVMGSTLSRDIGRDDNLEIWL